MSAQWRVIVDDDPLDGAQNMALDRALQLRHAAGDGSPTLRLYRWRVPTVTLGRFQPVTDVDRDACSSAGVDVVRRFTGGRGVLHDDEITYSLVAGLRDGIPRGVAASYRALSEILVVAYRSLGVDAEMTSRPRGRSASAACYLHATKADLSLGEAKLSGSAQVWHDGVVLQHGSIVRSKDAALEARVFKLGEGGSRELRAVTATLEDVLGQAPESAVIVDALVQGLTEVFDATVVRNGFSSEERQLAASLREQVVV